MLFATVPVHAAALIPRKDPIIDLRYRGGFLDDFPAELNLVKPMVRNVQLDVSSQLGFLQYHSGFLHPVTVRFTDGAPAITENPFFYIQPTGENDSYSQVLNANVEAFAKNENKVKPDDAALRKAFTYAMAEVILNDLAGGDSDKALPIWAQEGLAVYVSGMGEEMVQKVGAEVTRSHVEDLVEDLNRPFPILTRRQFARYYLATKYIVETSGSSTLQAFIRDLLNGKSAADSIRNVLGQEWPVFEKNVRAFTITCFARFAREDEPTTLGTSGSPTPTRHFIQ